MARLNRKTLWIVTAALVAVVVLLQFCPAARQKMNAYTLKTSSGVLTIDQFESPERRLFVLASLTSFPPGRGAVSYTHLTLPTICSV